MLLFDFGKQTASPKENQPSLAPPPVPSPETPLEQEAIPLPSPEDVLPEPETQETLERDGRDELNLAEFPLCRLSDQQPAQEDSLSFSDTIFDRGSSREVKRILTISGSGLYGLPTASDSDVLLGLIQITRRHSGFRERTVAFTRWELLKMVRWPDTGRYYARLEESLNRWTGVTLYYDHAWWDKVQKSWVNEKFHILERVSLRQRQEGVSTFTWSEVVFASFRAENMKSLDLDFYFRLKLPTTRRLFRFLDKRFYQRPQWDFDLRIFACEHLGMSRKYHNGEIKRRLMPAIRELEDAGFLVRADEKERFASQERGEWRASFARADITPGKTGACARQIASATPDLLPVPLPEPTPPTGLNAELQARGVAPMVAASLVTDFEPSVISRRLAVYDWLLSRKDTRIGINPAGYLVASLRKNFQEPPDYQASLVAAAEQAAPPRRQTVRRSETPEPPAHDAVSSPSPLDAYLARLTPGQRTTLEEEALAGDDGFFRDQLRKCSSKRLQSAIRRSAMIRYLRDVKKIE